jgi:hypothetical protein
MHMHRQRCTTGMDADALLALGSLGTSGIVQRGRVVQIKSFDRLLPPPQIVDLLQEAAKDLSGHRKKEQDGERPLLNTRTRPPLC